MPQAVNLFAKEMSIQNWFSDMAAASWFDSSMLTKADPLGYLKYFNSLSFVAKPVKYWNGTSWVIKPLWYWNGSTWLLTNFNPLSVFTGGVTGCWYDRSDLSTMFKNIGSLLAPVTADGDLVDLMLDKSQSLVLESDIAVNGGFSTAASWTTGVGVTISGGRAQYSSVALEQDSLYQNVGINNNLYEVTFTVSNYVSGSVGPFYGSFRFGSVSANGTYTFRAMPIGNTNLIFKATANNTTLDIDNVIVRRVSGSHLLQPTGSAVPKWRARKNWLLDTEDPLTVSAYAPNITVSKNVITAPDGTLSADKVILNTVLGPHGLGSSGFDLEGSVGTFSFHFKAGGHRYIRVRPDNNVAGHCLIDVDTLALTNSQSSITSNIVTLSDSWYRVAVTGPTVNAGGGRYSMIQFSDAGGSDNITGNGVDGLHVWGLQLEVSLVPTAYQRVNTDTDYDTIGFSKYIETDGINDYFESAVGGGSTTAFCYMACVRPTQLGVRQTLFSDAGTNTGYKVELNASNQLVISAGNGTSYTTATTANTFTYGQIISIEAYDDGTNLGVVLNKGTLVIVARPVVIAGTASFTMSRDNGAASGYFKGGVYDEIYTKNKANTVVERSNSIAYLRLKGGI